MLKPRRAAREILSLNHQRHSGSGKSKGNKYGNTCSAASNFRTARDRNLTTSPFDKLPCNPEPDPGSQIAFRGEKRLEDLFPGLLFGTPPGVPDCDFNDFAGRTRNFACRESQNSSTPHRIHGVCDEVREHLKHFAAGYGDLL